MPGPRLIVLVFAFGCSSGTTPSAGVAADATAASNAGSEANGRAASGADPVATTDGTPSGGAAPTGAGGVTNTTDSDSGTTDLGSGGAGAVGGEVPYANVVAVAVSGDSGGYTFNVSVESADIDCTQYADWWEVLSEDGVLLYRRIIDHSHTDENGTSDPGAPGNTFTRSGGPVDIGPDDVVLVRSHMNPQGYNGAVMLGTVSGGFSAAADIGPDFAVDVEDDAPQPDGCLF